MTTLQSAPSGTAIGSILQGLQARLKRAKRKVLALTQAVRVAEEVAKDQNHGPKPGTLAAKALKGLQDAPGAIHTKVLAKSLGMPENLLYVTLARQIGNGVSRVAPSTWQAA